MKFKFVFILFFLFSCAPNNSSKIYNKPYSAKGFAYIYKNDDYEKKIIKTKMNNDILQVSHQNLRIGALIKILNPMNNKSIVLKNSKKAKYPEFYKILISQPVAEQLGLNSDLPLIELTEIKKNKSFVAKKAKIYSEEKKIPSKAPVASVMISNISKNKKKIEKEKRSDLIFIHIATFYSTDTAKFLRKRIILELSNFDEKKIMLKKVNNKETQVISGPYTTINSLKNDYIKLKSFGFEELDVFINE